MTLAEVLSAETERQSVSLNELARRSGMSAGRVHGIVTGSTPNPGLLTVLQLLAAYGRSLGWLARELAREKNTEKGTDGD